MNKYKCLNYINNVNALDEQYINKIFIKMFNILIKKPSPTKISFFSLKKNGYYIKDIGIITDDKPAIIETLTGYLHSIGYNVFLNHAFVFPFNKQNKAFILLRLKLNEEEFSNLKKIQHELKKRLKSSIKQSPAISYLISMEVEKLVKYDEVYNIIKKTLPKEEIKEIINSRGELIKFFTNRTKAYISERSAQDIFKQIYNNYKFIKLLNEDPEKKFLFNVENLKTQKELLTGISLVGYSNAINLNMILHALRKSVPDFLIKFIKKFSIEDKTVFRIEICNKQEQWYDYNSINRLKTALETLRSQGYLLSLESFDSIGGFEQYARAIIPILDNECKKTGIPQFYLSLENKQEYLIELKIMVIFNKEQYNIDNFALKLASDLNNIKGFHIFKIFPPTQYSKNEINMVDIRIETEYWNNTESIYIKIKEILGKYLDKFRDFDEGMRLMDNMRLKFAIENLKKYPEDVIMNFYYHLNEFYRISIFQEELILVLKNAIKAYYDLKKHNLKNKLISKQIEINFGKKKMKTATTFFLAYTGPQEKMINLVEIFAGYQLNLSRIDYENITIFIVIINEHKEQVSQSDFLKMKKYLEKLIEQ